MRTPIANYRGTYPVYLFVDGKAEEHTIDVTWYDNGEKRYITDSDNDTEKRNHIISYFEMMAF